MRPIKFRVWHKPERKMHFYLKAKFGKGTNITLEGKFKDVDQITTKTVPNDDLEVMQFTGLYDQNGAEIFEGDIVRRDHASMVVSFEDGAFRLDAGNADRRPSPFHQDRALLVEVVGNIYENPELLNS
jgi:uncharacterized phage protein (TIGR01671 family)